MDESLAASGLLVIAIDLRRAPEAPYPASVQDANYGVRWLKAKAREWNGDPASVGALGSSSGGHEIELCAMRPHDPRYNAHALPDAPNVDATLPYVVARSPVSDPFARYQQAERRQWAEMIQNSKTFQPLGNHLRRQSAAHPRTPRAGDLAAALHFARRIDDNVLPAVQEKLPPLPRSRWRMRVEIFQGCEHRWVASPSPQTDRAYERIKAFIARQLGARGAWRRRRAWLRSDSQASLDYSLQQRSRASPAGKFEVFCSRFNVQGPSRVETLNLDIEP